MKLPEHPFPCEAGKVEMMLRDFRARCTKPYIRECRWLWRKPIGKSEAA